MSNLGMVRVDDKLQLLGGYESSLVDQLLRMRWSISQWPGNDADCVGMSRNRESVLHLESLGGVWPVLVTLKVLS